VAADAGTALGGAQEFVDRAVEHLAACLGETHPLVGEGRRVGHSLAAIPADALLVTQESLAAAMQRAFPYRQRTASGVTLSAATILAALRTDPAERESSGWSASQLQEPHR
jgi:hypothetical protein